ncbi:MAG: DUF5615 family PIN-like protein [Armatimonadetes bacterium]|nr:DUF5615 family PIN-like protein [Armatimonadota bacterium]
MRFKPPANVGLLGRSDPVQFSWAIGERRMLITRNHRDFEELHKLVLDAGGHHPGVVTVHPNWRSCARPDFIAFWHGCTGLSRMP